MTDQQREPDTGGETSTRDEVAAIKQSVGVIGAELCHLLDVVAPAEAQQHFRTARVEALKGVRALIDRRIQRLSADREKGTAIDIE